MRWLVFCIALGCGPPPSSPSAPALAPSPYLPAAAPAGFDPAVAGSVVDRLNLFAFDGGRIELDLRQDGDVVYEVAHDHYAVPIVMRWELVQLDNLAPTAATDGVALLPAAPAPDAEGPGVVLTTLQIVDPNAPYHRELEFHARFGNPDARPAPYAYRLPYPAGQTYSVLQGFHGAFSHRGSNEYAVDFDCPVATHVLAARPGIVVATNAAAQGAGTTPEFLELDRTNFVYVLHDDGTLGEYMHLAPSGVKVTPGQRVARGDQLALSGFTGFSSTPHLHFQVMTAAPDGIAARSFPFELAVAPGRVEAPVQSRAYASWE
jgi:murein DD-endopeptidase MepM/ murein hydrolase activator NlpD